MKKSQSILLVFFAAAAAVLRFVQMKNGFDENGLAVSGYPAALALPAVLVLAALCFVFFSRSYPAQRDVTGGLADCFLLQDSFRITLGTAGSFLILVSAALSFLRGNGSLLGNLFAAFAVASGLCLLYALFVLYRGGSVQAVALLVPVCYLVLRLIFLYRTDAVDPVLQRVYIELLAFSALTLSHLERAAFAFRGGAPRAYLPVSAMAVILSLAAMAELPGLPDLLLYLGLVLIELTFLSAADFTA